MPGKFVDEVHIFQCGTHSDGTAIMCSEIGYAKIPFSLSEDVPVSGSRYASESGSGPNLGWQLAGSNDVHIPLRSLVAGLKRFGITVTYDEEELLRRLGPSPASE
jgi:hypothetical protein